MSSKIAEAYAGAVWKGFGPKDDQPTRDQMEALMREPGYRRLRTMVETELERCRTDLETVHGEMACYVQGRVAALRWVLGVPQQIYNTAGGQRKLDEPARIEQSEC